MAHRPVEAAAGIVPVEVVDREGLREGQTHWFDGQRHHGSEGVEDIIAADLVRGIGESIGVGRIGGSQHQHGGVHRTGGQNHDISGPGLLALLAVGDHAGGGLAGCVGQHPHSLAACEQGDVGIGERRFDRSGAGVALGLEEARISAACPAFDAGAGERVPIVEVHAERQRERAPALPFEVGLKLLYPRVMSDGRIGVGWRALRLGRVRAACTVHLPQDFRVSNRSRRRATRATSKPRAA